MFPNFKENPAPDYTIRKSTGYSRIDLARVRCDPQVSAQANYHYWQVSHPNLQYYSTPCKNCSNPMRQRLQSGFPRSVAQQNPVPEHPKIQRSNIEVIYTVGSRIQYKGALLTAQEIHKKEEQLSKQTIHQLVDDHFKRSLCRCPDSSSEFTRSLQLASTVTRAGSSARDGISGENHRQ